MAKVRKTGKKKVKKNIPIGEVHIQSSFNNTIIT
ncbi:MAG: 30S ribosomal protein S11, partial [Syntrophorhabdales bacterium]